MPASAQGTLIVNQTSPACTAGNAYYTTIQSAIDAAASGGMVLVCPGIYNENVDVNKSLTVKSFSQNPNNTIVQAANTNDHVFDIRASWVNISGFTAQNATGLCSGWGCGGFYSDVYWPVVVGLNITNVVAVNNYRGVLFMRPSNSILANSVLANNSDGVYIYPYATNNTIVNNTISNSSTAIIVLSSNNTIANNSLKNNIIGISISAGYNYINNNSIENSSKWGIYLADKSNFITNNLVINSGDYGILLGVGVGGTRYNTIKGNIVYNASYYGIYLSGSSSGLLLTDNTISYNLVTNGTRVGMRIERASNNSIAKNQLINNRYNGIFLYESSNNVIENNNITSREFLQEGPEGVYVYMSNGTILIGNTISYISFGVYIHNSYNTTVINNNISESEPSCGINVQRSNGTLVYHNNFITSHACDDNNGTWWDGGYYKGGNYWSSWTSPDNLRGTYQNESGSDGIVDYPYNISSGTNKDRYPFVKPSGWLDFGAKFSLPSDTPRINTTITIPINFSTTIPVGSAQLYLLYNSSVINATHVTAGSSSQGALFSSKINNSEGKITIVVVSVDGISTVGSLADIEFSVIGPVNSSTALRLVREGVTDAKNNELNVILNDGTLTVISYPTGDVTGDNEITVADALMYLRFAAGEPVENVNPLHDVTCDGKITAADALLVLRKAVGQDVSLEC